MKKPYQPPKLTNYGNLTQMTLGMTGGLMTENFTKMMRT
jgi:hypothetical protein